MNKGQNKNTGQTKYLAFVGKIADTFRYALRMLTHNKTYSLINIIGLSVGLATGIFSLLYANELFKYDKFHKNVNTMYRLLSFEKSDEGYIRTSTYNSAAIGGELMQYAAEIEDYSRIAFTNVIIKNGENFFNESGCYADLNFFSFFSFNLLTGNKLQAISHPNAIVISEKLANKIFSTHDVTGKSLELLINGKPQLFTINGVFEDVIRSSYRFEFVIPMQWFLTNNPWANDLKSPACETVLRLKPRANKYEADEKVKNLLSEKNISKSSELFLQPFGEMRMYYYVNGVKRNSGMATLIIMCSIGFLILFTSAFNFINTSIAFTIKRMHEAAMKKILSASKMGITMQFLAEGLIISMLAMLLSFVILEHLLPAFNRIDLTHMEVDYGNVKLMSAITAFSLTTGLLTALYPAIRLSIVSPLQLTKNNSRGRRQKIGIFRQSLIVFQFTISIIMLVGFFVYRLQANYMLSKDLGIDKSDILFFNTTDGIKNHRDAIVSEIKKMPEVTSACWSSQNPLSIYNNTSNVEWLGKQPDEKPEFTILHSDTSFSRVFRPGLVDGRFFDAHLLTDSCNFIVNAEAVKKMNLKDPVGQVINVDGIQGVIVGVIENFNSRDLYTPYMPLIIGNNPAKSQLVFIRYNRDKEKVYENLKKLYTQYEPNHPFDGQYLNSWYEGTTMGVRMTSLILITASFFSLFLACIGLWGLAFFTVETRTKEIGIRKANGASIFGIVSMFLKSYAKWIFIGAVIGIPIGYMAWSGLLNLLVFKITFPYWALLAAPLLVLLVSWCTVGSMVYRVSNRNPVEALRYE